MMNGHERSGSVIVAAKPANKAAHPAVEQSTLGPAAAELGEPRTEAEGNADQPGAEPDKRGTGAGAHTESRKGKEEGEVHRALPPHQHRAARRGVPRTQGGRSTRRGSADMEGLRGRPRAQARGLARSGPTGSVPGVAEPASLHTQAGRTTAVCIENLIRFDCVAESHNVSANGRADILLAERGCLALQV